MAPVYQVGAAHAYSGTEKKALGAVYHTDTQKVIYKLLLGAVICDTLEREKI